MLLHIFLKCVDQQSMMYTLSKTLSYTKLCIGEFSMTHLRILTYLLQKVDIYVDGRSESKVQLFTQVLSSQTI